MQVTQSTYNGYDSHETVLMEIVMLPIVVGPYTLITSFFILDKPL
uniref:Uncharacterized protein n=1 Tax=Picea glauca TaxID=3330 RepID=A0A101M0P0_PICGL|nr:hypothetical protein ABT39_MTgene4192 [Picea glauca]